MSHKFTAPSSRFASPCHPLTPPTYGYGIVVKGLFKYAPRDREFGRWPSVLYSWTN
jgi:hypothetical protein